MGGRDEEHLIQTKKENRNRDVLIPSWPGGDQAAAWRAEICLARQLLGAQTAARGAAGENSQLERPGSRAELGEGGQADRLAAACTLLWIQVG